MNKNILEIIKMFLIQYNNNFKIMSMINLDLILDKMSFSINFKINLSRTKKNFKMINFNNIILVFKIIMLDENLISMIIKMVNSFKIKLANKICTSK